MEGSYPEGGVAILRESFDDSAIFFSFVGEHGKARKDGLGHEHPDELSLIISLFRPEERSMQRAGESSDTMICLSRRQKVVGVYIF